MAERYATQMGSRAACRLQIVSMRKFAGADAFPIQITEDMFGFFEQQDEGFAEEAHDSCKNILDPTTPLGDLSCSWDLNLGADPFTDILSIPDEDLPDVSHDVLPIAGEVQKVPPCLWSCPYFRHDEPTAIFYSLSTWNEHEAKHSYATTPRCVDDHSKRKTANGTADVVTRKVASRKTGRGKLSCNSCNKKYTYRGHLERHVMRHEIRKFACEICKKTFGFRDLLRCHKISHEKKRYNCPHCEYTYNSKSQLTRHFKRCHSEQLFNCHLCSQIFVAFDEYNEHVTDKACQFFKCTSCDATFMKVALYKQHVRLHVVGKKHCCEICNQPFEARAKLIRHKKLKHSPHRFTCELCSKTFVRQDHYQIHMRRHNNHKPCRCDFCDSRFCQKSDLNRHRKYVHLGIVRSSTAKMILEL